MLHPPEAGMLLDLPYTPPLTHKMGGIYRPVRYTIGQSCMASRFNNFTFLLIHPTSPPPSLSQAYQTGKTSRRSFPLFPVFPFLFFLSSTMERGGVNGQRRNRSLGFSASLPRVYASLYVGWVCGRVGVWVSIL